MGAAPGYYPGLVSDVAAFERTEWDQWFAAHRADIDDIFGKIKQIKSGQLRPGCLGRDRWTCVATLAQTTAVADNFVLDHLFDPPQVDVNGKLIRWRVSFSGFIPGYHELYGIRGIVFELEFDERMLVKSLRAGLPRDPLFAQTQEEYDKTGAYEVIAAMVLTACPHISHGDVARFIENQVKPAIRTETSKRECSPAGGCISGEAARARGVSYCGETMRFSSIYGRDTNMITGQNRHGSFGGASIVFE